MLESYILSVFTFAPLSVLAIGLLSYGYSRTQPVPSFMSATAEGFQSSQSVLPKEDSPVETCSFHA